MVVIIGAGPAGLYAGIKLAKAGADVIIFDPRAGIYTRPGHLGAAVFAKAQEGIGKTIWKDPREDHIKELERILHTEALLSGIDIQNKRFARLHPDATSPGVVVIDDATGLEEIIPADYVLDCTGARRDVIHNVNNVIAESPLKLSTFTELPLPTHMIANVRLSSKDFALLSKTTLESAYFHPTMPDDTYARLIIELRTLGWNELKFPRCYGAYYGKNKACLYLQTPTDLPKEKYDAWLNLVLRCYFLSGKYEHLPPSKKYDYKPRFITFPVKAQALEHVAYRGLNLPMVIALGDAQIDAYFRLAHGILNGMQRIDAFVDKLAISDGKITFFDPDAYLATIKASLDSHKEAIIVAAHRQKLSLSAALPPGKLKLLSAMIFLNADEREFVHFLLMGLDIAATKIASDAEQKIITESFARLARCWRTIAHLLSSKGNWLAASNAYKKMIEIYQRPEFKPYPTLSLVAHYELACCYDALEDHMSALYAANQALDIYKDCVPGPITIEIILLLIAKNFEKESFSLLLMGEVEKASNLHRIFSNMIGLYKASLSPALLLQVETLAAGIKECLTPPLADKSPSASTNVDSVTLTIDETDETIIVMPRLMSSMELHAPATKVADIGLFKSKPSPSPYRERKNKHCAMF